MTTSCPTWAECLRDANRAHFPLDHVVIDLDAAIIEEQVEAAPVALSVDCH
jgi:hypothetical protein